MQSGERDGVRYFFYGGGSVIVFVSRIDQSIHSLKTANRKKRSSNNPVPVPVTPPDSFIDKTVRYELVGVNEVPTIDNHRVLLPGEHFYVCSIQQPVLVMSGKDHDRIRTPDCFIDIALDWDTGIFSYVRIVDTDSRTVMNQIIAEGF
jgi:hypothetical protein